MHGYEVHAHVNISSPANQVSIEPPLAHFPNLEALCLIQGTCTYLQKVPTTVGGHGGLQYPP